MVNYRVADLKAVLEELRAEGCDVDLPPDSPLARICTFEGTFCATCAERKLNGTCPNCGGELLPRPRRRASRLATKVVGSVQLALCEKENGRHRAEVHKLIVLTLARGLGISSRLMLAAEARARSRKRSLLVLDTLLGSHAESVYRHPGWQRAGEIPEFAAAPDGELTVYCFKRLEP